MNFSKLVHEYSKTDYIAHCYRESELSYRELEEKSNALAVYLIQKYGIDKTPILIHGHKEHQMLVCILACIKSGHPYIPVDSSTPVERVLDILKISGACMAFNASAEELPIDVVEVLNGMNMENLILAHQGCVPEEKYCTRDEDVHYIIYTSGSTGKPKGVKITANCLTSFVHWAANFGDFGQPGKHVIMNQAPFSFDLSVMDLYLSLFSGSTLFSIDKAMISSLKQLFEYFRTSDIDIWVSTPSFAEMCLSDSSFNEQLLPKLRLMLFCGETLSNSCAQRLKERFHHIKVINTYGPTEATVAVTAIEVDEALFSSASPLPVGRIKEECSLYIVREAQGNISDDTKTLEFDGIKYQIQSDGETGEIVIAGKSVSPGYLNNEEATRKVFLKRTEDGIEQRYYRTGDEGYMENGLLYYQGRIDFQVKLNGFRIELGDIENNLTELPNIESAVVLPVMKEGKPVYLAAAVVLSQVSDEKSFVITQKIREALKNRLPEYMVPRKIMIKEVLPMTTNGKIDRKLLMEEIK